MTVTRVEGGWSEEIGGESYKNGGDSLSKVSGRKKPARADTGGERNGKDEFDRVADRTNHSERKVALRNDYSVALVKTGDWFTPTPVYFARDQCRERAVDSAASASLYLFCDLGSFGSAFFYGEVC